MYLCLQAVCLFNKIKVLHLTVLLVGYSVRDKIKVLESSTPRYIKTWEVTDLAGENFTVDAPYRDPRFATEDFTIVSTLPDDIKDGSYLCFITRGSVDVYIDGDLRKSFDVALSNAGDSEELLEVIAGEITKEYGDRISRMKGFIKDKNYKGYEIEAHALKGLMATIGVSSMSERAREHEKAAEEGDMAFIEKDAGSFLAEYEKLCKRIAEG